MDVVAVNPAGLKQPLADAFIHVDDLSLDFPLYHGGARSLKKTMLSMASKRVAGTTGGKVGEDRSHRVVVQALRNITFRLTSGERLGIVGHNGAGKSSLLRVLGGIYEPVAGQVHVGGSINTLLDTNFGMNLDLTGRENIALRGRYVGLSREGMRALEADVEAFAALGPFLELPVRVYSSGMVVRLGFGLATAIAPQVLLMDEWFMAGDARFRDKAHSRLETVVRGAEIMVLTSHMPSVLKTWCTRLIWLQAGRIVADGPVDEIMERYAAAAVPAL
ncbi:ABC transporter ATP-binding protein [Lichenicola cladoniae]|uniref:ABC transporter ATP-binding protein n=1 Tax=Lichenicola cladoniae TaxID=1484109 RepID=A0A6M8GZ46_9PROT|nr:ABC transporter ATP-binding protein [Lichenicola cladoniae]NPD68566.1 ABC transporter ATP-binding protein [Acetobacteraceae bacterium]QKE88954.1 ABC transporter ATP-binding protein [Lichenicola cladoniae]